MNDRLTWEETTNEFNGPEWNAGGWKIRDYGGDGGQRFSVSTEGVDYRFRQSYGSRATLAEAQVLVQQLQDAFDGTTDATIARLSGVIEKDWLDEWIDAEWPVTATSHQTRTRRAGARLLRDAILAKAKTEGA